MADFSKRVPENVPGDFFVDATCIDCDACRQLAPCIFGEGTDTSYVRAQPINDAQRRTALHALLACPTGSIGNRGHGDLKAARDDFPLEVEHPVYYCGFNARTSYGGNSYLLLRNGGNWMIDSPKFLRTLVGKLEQWGGIETIFLTHEDDVADAARYAAHFGARRVIHREELAAQPDAEIVLDGTAPVELSPGVLAIPTPGHTAGHCCLLVDQRFLFTGDHLSWSRRRERLSASRDYCWYSWPLQVQSMATLAEYRFEWVLPGHGQRVRLPADAMQQQMQQLVRRMRATV